MDDNIEWDKFIIEIPEPALVWNIFQYLSARDIYGDDFDAYWATYHGRILVDIENSIATPEEMQQNFRNKLYNEHFVIIDDCVKLIQRSFSIYIQFQDFGIIDYILHPDHEDSHRWTCGDVMIDNNIIVIYSGNGYLSRPLNVYPWQRRVCRLYVDACKYILVFL